MKVSLFWLLGKPYWNFQLLTNQEFWPFKLARLLLRKICGVFSRPYQYFVKFLSDWLHLSWYWNYLLSRLSGNFLSNSSVTFSLTLWFWRASDDYESLDCHLVTLSNFYYSHYQAEQMIEYCQSSSNLFSSVMLFGRFWAWTSYVRRSILWVWIDYCHFYPYFIEKYSRNINSPQTSLK